MSSALSSILVRDTRLKDKYSVGECADMAGVPDVFTAADSSLWMAGNTFVSGALLPVSVKERLAQSYDKVSMSDYDALFAMNTRASAYFEAPTVGNTKVFPTYNGSSNGVVLVVNEGGPQLVSTGLAASRIDVVSDGTYFYAVAASGQFTTSKIKRSVNGLQWEFISGATNPNTLYFPSGGGCYKLDTLDDIRGKASGTLSSSGAGFGVFYFGSRIIAIGINGGYTAPVVLSSSNGGISWTDISSTFSGGGTALSVYRNGNNALVAFSGIKPKFSSDGGATFTDATSAITSHVTDDNSRLQLNRSTASKFIILNSSLQLIVSTNSGQSTASIESAISSFISDVQYGIAYKGSTIMLASSTGVIIKSTNDGSSFTQVSLPSGVQGVVNSICCDDDYFYIFMSSGQMIVSSDLVSFSILNAAAASTSSKLRYMEKLGAGIYAGIIDSSIIYTVDGWLTSNMALKNTTSVALAHIKKVTCGSSVFAVLGGKQSSGASPAGSVSSLSAFQSRGSYFRATSGALSPIRTGATAMVRVA